MQCKKCGVEFTPARSDAVYCSQACRQSAYRGRSGGPVNRHVTDAPVVPAYDFMAALNDAVTRVAEAVPKKYHVQIEYLVQSFNIHGQQLVKAQLEDSDTHKEYRDKLDAEWEKIEKARAELVKLEADYKRVVLKYEGISSDAPNTPIGEGVLMNRLKESDLKVIRGFLHPDKYTDEGQKMRAGKAYDAFDRAIVRPIEAWSKQCTIPTLESYGWTKTVAERRAKKAKA